MGIIAENIRKIQAEKAAAAERSGRKAEDVLLCAVTKMPALFKNAISSSFSACEEGVSSVTVPAPTALSARSIHWAEVITLQPYSSLMRAAFASSVALPSTKLPAVLLHSTTSQ